LSINAVKALKAPEAFQNGTPQTVIEVVQPETAPFIQIRKKVQALRITTRNRAEIPEQPDTGEIKPPL